MKLANMTWFEVKDLSRDTLVVIPTGSFEQHGRHLPLITDTLIVTSVAEEVEKEMPDRFLLTPTVWLGASAHHLPFTGTLSAALPTYTQVLDDLIMSLVGHGFWRFYIVNGHGGNVSPNDVALRTLKAKDSKLFLGHCDYYSLMSQALLDETLQGPVKYVDHGGELETSLMLHLAPDSVRIDRLSDDGLRPENDVKGLVMNFDELTEHGSHGFASLASPEAGKILFEVAVHGLRRILAELSGQLILVGLEGMEG